MSRAEDIARGLAIVRARIDEATRAAGRAPGSAALIAVSKKMPPDDLRAAHAAGQLDFGENYAQELRDKRAVLREGRPSDAGARDAGAVSLELRWHYIGPLQTNKIKYLAGQVHLIHSVDSPEAVLEIDRRAAGASRATSPTAGLAAPPAEPTASVARQRCLVQVNIAGEAGKSGVELARLSAVLDRFATCTHAACVGLMVIPPYAEDPGETRRHFAALRALAERERRVARPNVALRELSMGMSHDFVEAVAEGATMVRVGTAIFGARA